MKRIAISILLSLMICAPAFARDKRTPPIFPPPLATQAEAEAGTATSARSWTPLLVKQAIAALAGTGDVTGPASPTAGAIPKWAPSGKELVDSSITKVGTMTDGKLCTWTTANGLTCTAGSADFALTTGSIWIGTDSKAAETALGTGVATGLAANINGSNGFLTGGGGVLLNDSSPDADGEYGYASNAFLWFANSEDFKITASSNMWTFDSNTSAAFTFTPAVTITGKLTPNGGIASLTPVIDDADNFDDNFTGANLYGGTFIANAAGTIVLPEPAAGMNFTIVLEGANAVIIDPLGTGTADTIYMNGLAAAGDENITSSTSGAMCVFQYRAANTWMATCNGFAEATPP